MPYHTLQQQFSIAAKQYPQEIALRFIDKTMTYQELDEITTQFANFLLKRNIKPEDKIAVYLPRSLELIIAIIGILKAGACYVPIAANYPKERIHYILMDSKPQFLVTAEQEDFAETPTLSMSSFMNDRHRQAKILPHISYHPHHAAYVIYTSGSTGNPKGVLIEQAAISNFIQYSAIQWEIEPKTKVLQFANICFDRSVQEWATTLLYGGELNLVTLKDLPPYRDISDLINDLKINVLGITPSVLATLDTHRHYPYLQTISCGGEAMNQSLVDEWAGKVKLLNEYGPSETSVIATLDHCIPNQPVTIGKPVPHVTAYVVDEHLKPVQPNKTGELLIGGICLAREYLNKPELTKEKFIKNPFSADPKSRVYRTGDFVKLLSDGKLSYIGRKDDQVKIRGYRIELEEITAVLASHEKITLAATKIFSKNEQQKKLVCYYTTKDKGPLMENDLRSFLSTRLADYMLPDYYLFMQDMPLTASDKVDKKLLPEPIITVENLSHPITPLGLELGELWGNILNVPIKNIDIHTSFFSLGGNSLSLVRMIQDINLSHQVSITLDTFLMNPTIVHLEKLILKKENHKEKLSDLIQKELKKDMVLPRDIQFTKKNDILPKPQHVLLTGVSGFLGIYLLKAWLLHTEAKLYCLVRAASIEHAKQRIIQNLQKYQLEHLDAEERIIPVLGNLAEKKLGLTEPQWENLADNIDTIIHNGAMVHYLYSYSQLKATNVASTLDLIRLAAQGKNKIIHYISSISAITDFTDNGEGLETPPTPNFLPHFSGYELSKWASEYLLWQAKQKGLACRIYRPGNITGDDTTGISNAENNHFWSLIKSCMQLNAAPNWPVLIEMTPVNILAQAIFNLANSHETNDGIYHLNNPLLVPWVKFIDMLQQAGISIPLITTKKWLEKIKHIDDKNALFPFKLLYLKNNSSLDFPLKPIQTEKTQMKLQEMGMHYPSNYLELLKLYIQKNLQ